MRRGVRIAVAVASLALIGCFVAPAIAHLPPAGVYTGPYGDAVVPLSLDQRKTTNVTAAVAYDIRELDTLGEEAILVGAVAGIGVLLRPAKGRGRPGKDRVGELQREPGASRPALRLASADVLPIALVFGAYMTLHATTTPGGGFQGGAIMASALTLVYVGFSYEAWHRVIHDSAMEITESAGMLGFLALVLVPLALGKVFGGNWLPDGTSGKVGSGGAMFVLNLAIALAVTAGFVLIAGELLRELHEREE